MIQLWTSNLAGWDGKGATLACLCVRYSEDGGPERLDVDPADNIMILAITLEIVAQNAPEAFKVLHEPDLMGHTGASGPHTRYTNFKVPLDVVLFAPGKATPVIEQAFGVTAALVGAMAVGTMRAAFERALEFAKWDGQSRRISTNHPETKPGRLVDRCQNQNRQLAYDRVEGCRRP